MKFAIVHSEQPDPPQDQDTPMGRVPRPVPPSTLIAAAKERLHTRANADAHRALARLDRLRHTVQIHTAAVAARGEAFEDTEPEEGLEMFRASAFGPPPPGGRA